jgi:hypothetical protein
MSVAPARGSVEDLTPGAILDRFLHHAQTIAVTGRRSRLKGHATVAGNDDEIKSPNPSPANVRPPGPG